MHIVRSTIASEDILQLLTRSYGYPEAGAVCMLEYRGVNDIYRYSDGHVSVFLKVYARRDLDADAVTAEVELVDHLRHSGLSVAWPIPAVDGRPSVTLETPEGIRHAVLFSEAEGVPCDNDALDAAQTAAIGRLMGTMHTALDALPGALKRWRLDEATFLDRSLEILEDCCHFNHRIDLGFLRQVVGELKARIRTNSANWGWGLCHGDLYTGNIHCTTNGQLTIFDFDFCGYGWRAYDVSPFLGSFSTGIDPAITEWRQRRLEAFLRGYNAVSHLSPSEIEAVYTVFVPFRRIFNMGYLYDTLLYVWGNKLRTGQITHDQQLLKDWVAHYW